MGGYVDNLVNYLKNSERTVERAVHQCATCHIAKIPSVLGEVSFCSLDELDIVALTRKFGMPIDTIDVVPLIVFNPSGSQEFRSLGGSPLASTPSPTRNQR